MRSYTSSAAPPRGSVIQVCDFGGPYPGNFIASQIALGRAVRDRLGLDCSFVFSDVARGRRWLSTLESEGFRFSFIERGSRGRHRRRAFESIAAEQNATLLDSHFTTFDPDCALVGRKHDLRVVWHIHSGIAKYTLKRRAKDLVKVRVLGRYCDRVIAVSPWVRDLAVMRGFPRGKVEVVLNGIVLEAFGERPAGERERTRTALGVSDRALMIVSFCWYPEIKGADLILRALAEPSPLADDAPIELVMVGTERMESYVDRILDGRRPSWLRLTRPTDDVAALLGAGDVFVSAARHEGFSFAIGEAMASRLPVVSSDIPGAEHWFEADGVITFRSGDSNGLRSAIGKLTSAARRFDLGKRNREFVLERFGIDRWVDETISVYRGLLGPGEGG